MCVGGTHLLLALVIWLFIMPPFQHGAPFPFLIDFDYSYVKSFTVSLSFSSVSSSSSSSSSHVIPVDITRHPRSSRTIHGQVARGGGKEELGTPRIPNAWCPKGQRAGGGGGGRETEVEESKEAADRLARHQA